MFVQILKQAWLLSRRNYFLWFLGFLSSFFLIFITNEVFLTISGVKQVINNYFFPPLLNPVREFFSNGVNELTTFFVVYLPLLIIFFAFSILAEISLVVAIEKIRKKNSITLVKAIKKAKRYFWSVALIHLATFLIIYLPFFLIIFLLPSQWFNQEAFLFFFVFLNILFLIIFTFIFFLIARFTIFYLVIKKKRIFSALKKSLILLKNNRFKVLTLSFILFFCLVIFMLINFVLFEGLKLPLRTSIFFLSKMLGPAGFYFTLLLGSLMVVILQIILSSIFAVYLTSCWLLLFFKIRKEKMLTTPS